MLLRCRHILLAIPLTAQVVLPPAAMADQVLVHDLNGGTRVMSDVSNSSQHLSIRLIFEYEGEDVRLVTQQPVDVLTTGFDVTRTQREGYFVDTRDVSGRTLARVPARGAFQLGAEVFPEHPGEPITRVEAERPRGAFTVIVPVAADADHVSVVQVRSASSDAALPTTRAASQPSEAAQEREIARFPLQLSR